MAFALRRIIYVFVLLWVGVILLISGPYILGSEPEDQVVARLSHAIKELEALKQKNEKLQLVLNSLKNMKKKKVTRTQSNTMCDIYSLFGWLGCAVTSLLDGEIVRRRVENGVREMWYRTQSELLKLNSSSNSRQVGLALAQLADHKRTILEDLRSYSHLELMDDWRRREAQELSDLLQKKFHYLQNPPDCNTAKKLVCNLNKGCGYGCQIHHAVYCFIVAYGTQRTLILRSQNWRYAPGGKGWESVFLPVSDTCTSDLGSSRASWPAKDDIQVVDLPIVDNLRPRPPYLPLAVPADLRPRLERLHGDPSVWWIGQILKFLLRPQEDLKAFLLQSEVRLGFKHPIVGWKKCVGYSIHVRRTDKIGTEAAFHQIGEYMEHVEDYFKQVELSGRRLERLAYLATDDPHLLDVARSKFPHYTFLGDQSVAISASLANRYSRDSLRGIILDIHMLSKCDYLVCTFSSQASNPTKKHLSSVHSSSKIPIPRVYQQYHYKRKFQKCNITAVCRLAYEIMQTFHPDASSYYKSLDDIFYFGGQNDHNQVALYDHTAASPEEIDLKKGDMMGIAGNHWNGFSKGINRRTKKSGLYPSYKAGEKLDWVDLPSYPTAS
ncbi:FUT8 [Cordylochernes scorpioides]|uniref:FUT8 n=1 Tax=Cordylochernes scorpioides TaxID=51811 RepID=A0ABY6KPD4_9ARAC|nr:FUT8 [Cordylochernes scorpioides]